MAKLIWTEPAVADLNAIAEYIAIDNIVAAKALVQRIYKCASRLQRYLQSGAKPPELGKTRYRQLIEPPCRIFYRYERQTVYVVHVMRQERQLRQWLLKRE